MADFSITVHNSIRSFGPAPSTKWGSSAPNTMTWGSGRWGEGTQDLIVIVTKVIGNSVTVDGPTPSLTADFSQPVNFGSVASDFEMSLENLRTGNGYYYVFTGDTSDADERSVNEWTESADASSTYSSAAEISTEWGEA